MTITVMLPAPLWGTHTLSRAVLTERMGTDLLRQEP